jgi:hypothetical protein
LFEKKVRISHFSEKKVLGCKKTGIANSKIDKNRIYLRRKGDDKNRKKKDFFPPLLCPVHLWVQKTNFDEYQNIFDRLKHFLITPTLTFPF